MIEWISNWAETIIVAVIIATIIEMILPEGSSKKYIKVVIGIYILFTIVSPIISNFSGKTLAVSDVLDLNQYIDEIKKESSQNILQQENSASIREIYIGNLKSDVENKLKGKGYVVTNIELDVGYDDNYTLNKVILSIVKEEDNSNNNDEHENDIDKFTKNEIEIVNSIDINFLEGNITTSDPNKSTDKKSNLNNSDKSKLKEYLSSIYEINEKNIIIN